MSDAIDFLTRLPDELLGLIIADCHDPVTLGNLTYLNRRFRALVLPTFERVAAAEYTTVGANLCPIPWLLNQEVGSLYEPYAFDDGSGSAQAARIVAKCHPMGSSNPMEQLVRYPWLPLYSLLADAAACPILLYYVRTIVLNPSGYSMHPPSCPCKICTYQRQQFFRFRRILDFGQTLLSALVGPDESIAQWDSPEGWTGLVLRACPNLSRLVLAGNLAHAEIDPINLPNAGGSTLRIRHQDHASRFSNIVESVLRQEPSRSLTKVTNVYAFRPFYSGMEPAPPWQSQFLQLPSLNTFAIPKSSDPPDRGFTNIEVHDGPSLRMQVWSPLDLLPMPALGRKMSVMPSLRKVDFFAVHETYHEWFTWRIGWLDLGQFGAMLQHLRSSLEELRISIDAYVILPANATEAVEIEAGERSSPLHLESSMNPHALLGSLETLTQLKTITVPAFAVFHVGLPRPFAGQFPPGLEVLELDLGVTGRPGSDVTVLAASEDPWGVHFQAALYGYVRRRSQRGRETKLRTVIIRGPSMSEGTVERIRQTGVEFIMKSERQ